MRLRNAAWRDCTVWGLRLPQAGMQAVVPVGKHLPHFQRATLTLDDREHCLMTERARRADA